MHWAVELVSDDFAGEWAIVDIEGEFTLICRGSALDADPERIYREVVSALRAARCPARRPPKRKRRTAAA